MEKDSIIVVIVAMVAIVGIVGLVLGISNNAAVPVAYSAVPATASTGTPSNTGGMAGSQGCYTYEYKGDEIQFCWGPLGSTITVYDDRGNIDMERSYANVY